MPQDQAVSAVGGLGVAGLVGPTRPDGWTAVWLEVKAADLNPREFGVSDSTAPGDGVGGDGVPELLMLDETRPGIELQVRTRDGAVHRHVWHGEETADPRHQPEQASLVEIAGVLAEMFDRPTRQEALIEALGHGDDIEVLLESLNEVLGLPPLEPADIEKGVVLHRGNREIAGLAASVLGPAHLAAPAAKWTIMLPYGGEAEPPHGFAAGVSASARRRDAVLLLWRAGVGCGWQLWSRGKLQAAWDWRSGWRPVVPDQFDEEAEVVQSIVRAARGPVDETALRVLLRRRDPADDPLAQFVELVGLPPDVLIALDDPEGFRSQENVVLVERVALRKAIWRAGMGDIAAGLDSSRGRWKGWLMVILALALSLLSVGMTVLGVAVVATGGAFVDQAGVTGEDWLFLVTGVALSLLVVPAAALQLRSVRRRTRAPGGS